MAQFTMSITNVEQHLAFTIDCWTALKYMAPLI